MLLLCWEWSILVGSSISFPSYCDTHSFRRVSSTNSFGTHPLFVLTHHMAAKKKGNESTSTEPPTSPDNAIVPSVNAVNSEDALVDHVTC